MRSEIKIRKARKNDLKEFVKLKRQDFEEYSKIIGKKIDVSVASIKKEFVRILSSKREYLFVMQTGKVIGFIHGKINNKLSKVTIEYVFVVKDFRKRGIASKLVREFLKKVKKENIRNVFLKVHVNNKNAIKLYKKLGFTLSSYEMKKELR